MIKFVKGTSRVNRKFCILLANNYAKEMEIFKWKKYVTYEFNDIIQAFYFHFLIKYKKIEWKLKQAVKKHYALEKVPKKFHGRYISDKLTDEIFNFMRKLYYSETYKNTQYWIIDSNFRELLFKCMGVKSSTDSRYYGYFN